MKQRFQGSGDVYQYRAPIFFLSVFYAALVAWTIVCVLLIGIKVSQTEWGNAIQLFMIGFIIAMTWYFSMGISYRVSMEDDGTLRLASLRRILRTDSRKVSLIEGPHLPVGFLRFRLEREKIYLFCRVKNKNLQEILFAIRRRNPETKFKNLYLNPEDPLGPLSLPT